jgi:hypothetical protein
MNRKAVAQELVKVAKLLVGSMQRHCAFYKAKDDKWYMELASREYEEQRKATTYGPFESKSEADHFLTDYFSNPGGSFTDDSGRKPVPTKSPNGSPVQNPKHHRNIWGTSEC